MGQILHKCARTTKVIRKEIRESEREYKLSCQKVQYFTDNGSKMEAAQEQF